MQAAFGIDQSFHFDGPFMAWLEPYTHLDGKRAFADINGSGHLPDLPALPPAVVGVAPDQPFTPMGLFQNLSTPATP